MKLEEQFKNDNLNLSTLESKMCAETAENFAIGFLDWYGERTLWEVNGKSTKELLEIYKETL